MPVPDVDAVAEPVKERAVGAEDAQLARAVFALLGVLDLAAEVMRHELHAVADAEDRQTELEDAGSGCGASSRIHAGRTAAEDETARAAFAISSAGVSKGTICE